MVDAGGLWFAQTQPYKASQGRTVRKVTLGVLALIVLLAGYESYVALKTAVDASGAYGWMLTAIPLALLVVGGWFAYRVVHMPTFADFLIAVEAEVNKVSWPSRGELTRSSIVVIATIFALAVVLFTFDTFWAFLFQLIGVRA